MTNEVFKRESDGITYYSTKPAPNTLKFSPAQRKAMGQKTYEEIMARNATPEETVETSELERVSAVVSLIGPMFAESKDARYELALRALAEGESAATVKAQAGVSWAIMETWVGKTKDHTIPKKAMTDISNAAEEARVERANDAAKSKGK